MTPLMNKAFYALGRKIPEKMILDVDCDSGFYMGLETKNGKGYYVGKQSEMDGNVLVAGINGSGKSFILAKSTVETWRDPFVILDCKGEHSSYYRYLQHQGRVKRECIIFDPITGGIHYDPFAILRKDDMYFAQNAREIAYALIPTQLNDPNSYWVDMARDLLSGIIIYGFYVGLDFSETMAIAVHDSVPELCKAIIESDIDDAKDFISDIAGLSKEQQAAIGTDMKRYVRVFATDRCVQEILSNTNDDQTFSWDKIVDTDDAPNVFLRLSQDRLEQWGGITKLMITQLIRTLERRPDKHSFLGRDIKPILLLLDEFPLLGKIEVITNALTTLRSKKVTFCLMLQSIAQLDAIYGSDVRKIIVDNCQFKVILNITEPDSQEYFSKLIGSTPVGKRSISQNFDPRYDYSTYGAQVQESREPIVLPHEFATNKDIWLHTPSGFLSAYKLPVLVTHKHAVDFDRILGDYRFNWRKGYDC